jgi:two-component system chemotaxis response regulator CheY
MLLFHRERNHRARQAQRPIYEPGTYVGPAVFKPRRLRDLRNDLRQAVGQVVELEFVTVANADERCAGQNIYMECPGTRSVLRGAWVADEDVQFLEPSHVEPEAPAVAPRYQKPLHATDTPLVLLVDDSRDTRQLYSFVLTNAGFQVVEAEDGLTAIDLARTTRPDAIVMDIDLPRMDGLEAIKLLRAESNTRRTPILVFTAHGEAPAAEAIRYGANTQCLKPCLPDAFLDSLRSILSIADMEPARR